MYTARLTVAIALVHALSVRAHDRLSEQARLVCDVVGPCGLAEILRCAVDCLLDPCEPDTWEANGIRLETGPANACGVDSLVRVTLVDYTGSWLCEPTVDAITDALYRLVAMEADEQEPRGQLARGGSWAQEGAH